MAVARRRQVPPTAKGRRAEAAVGVADFAETTYRSSRWSAGNFLFPDRLTLAADGVTFRKGAMFGSNEEHISYRAIASLRLKNGIFLSSLCIETSGGVEPIYINGLWKSKAREAQDRIRDFPAGRAVLIRKAEFYRRFSPAGTGGRR